MSGSYFNSRTIGKHVYFVVTQPTYVIFDTAILPKIYSSGKPEEIPASEIYYSNTSDNYYIFTTFIAINMQDTSEEPAHMSIIARYPSGPTLIDFTKIIGYEHKISHVDPIIVVEICLDVPIRISRLASVSYCHDCDVLYVDCSILVQVC